MMKKVVAGIVLVSLSGVLVVGAINRTSAKTDTSSAGWQEPQARNENLGNRGNGFQGSRGKGDTIGDQDGLLNQAESGNGYGRSRNATAGEALALSQDEGGHSWLQLEGRATSVDADALMVTLGSGEPIVVEGRAWSFTKEMGFAVGVGERVSLRGFFEDEEFVVGEIANLNSGQIVLLREPGGRPLWAGRGRRSS